MGYTSFKDLVPEKSKESAIYKPTDITTDKHHNDLSHLLGDGEKHPTGEADNPLCPS